MNTTFPLLVFNSLWPSDTIWRHESGSTLAQVMAWRHQAITWTNVDLSSVRSCGIHLSAILQEIRQQSVTEISLKIAYLNFCSNPPGVNELMLCLSGASWIKPNLLNIAKSIWTFNSLIFYSPIYNNLSYSIMLSTPTQSTPVWFYIVLGLVVLSVWVIYAICSPIFFSVDVHAPRKLYNCSHHMIFRVRETTIRNMGKIVWCQT